MKIIHFNLEDNDKYILDNEQLLVTIGAFDGIHLGHKKLLEKLISEKKNKGNNYKTAVLTFDIHPDFTLEKRSSHGCIEDKDDINKEFSSYGIDYLFLLKNDVLKLEYNDFHRLVLDRINVKEVVVGSEFKYGKGALGNINTLKKDYIVKTFLVLNTDGNKISSSQIRLDLENGKIEEVNKFLGEEYWCYFTIKRVEDCDGIYKYHLVLNPLYIHLSKGTYLVKIKESATNEKLIFTEDDIILESKYKIISKDNKLKINFVKKI